jgi:hypothetical protein
LRSSIRWERTTEDRRADFRVTEIDLCLFQQCLRLQNVGGLRDVLVVQELLAALQLQVGIDFGGLCFGEIGVLLVDGRLVDVGLNAEQKIAGLNLLAFGKVALVLATRRGVIPARPHLPSTCKLRVLAN